MGLICVSCRGQKGLMILSAELQSRTVNGVHTWCPVFWQARRNTQYRISLLPIYANVSRRPLVPMVSSIHRQRKLTAWDNPFIVRFWKPSESSDPLGMTANNLSGSTSAAWSTIPANNLLRSAMVAKNLFRWDIWYFLRSCQAWGENSLSVAQNLVHRGPPLFYTSQKVS